MSLSVCALASGSKGNSLLIESGRTKILWDAGLSARGLCARLEYAYTDPKDIEGIVVSHSHTDHVAALAQWIKKYDVPVYAHYRTARALAEILGGCRNIVELNGGDFYIGELTVSPFKVSHDVPCIGCSVYSAGRKISVLTDLGVLPESVLQIIADSDLVVLESNHDVEMLQKNPSYPINTKNRILSDRGHLSNAACAAAAARLAAGGVRQFVLAHLSEGNNSPALAYETVARALAAAGAKTGTDVFLDVALQDRPTKIFRLA